MSLTMMVVLSSRPVSVTLEDIFLVAVRADCDGRKLGFKLIHDFGRDISRTGQVLVHALDPLNQGQQHQGDEGQHENEVFEVGEKFDMD